MIQIDSLVSDILEETNMQGVEIPEEELAHLDQIQKSPEGRRLFSEISSFMIDTREHLMQFFEAVAEDRIFLLELLAHPELDKYRN